MSSDARIFNPQFSKRNTFNYSQLAGQLQYNFRPKLQNYSRPTGLLKKQSSRFPTLLTRRKTIITLFHGRSKNADK